MAAHLARHPFGRMPAFEHDGFALYETQAILRYIDRVWPAPSMTPTEPRAAARMDQVMNINDCYLFPGVANVIVFNRVIGPMLMGIAPDEAAIAAAMPAAETVLGTLSDLLGDKTYFAGENPSLADFLVAPQLDFFAMTPEWQPLTQGRANLVDWHARLAARPSMVATTMERVGAMARAA